MGGGVVATLATLSDSDKTKFQIFKTFSNIHYRIGKEMNGKDKETELRYSAIFLVLVDKKPEWLLEIPFTV